MYRCDVCKHKDRCVGIPFGCECFGFDVEYDAKIINKFAEELKSRLGDAIHPDDFESMRNLIDDVVKEKKNDNT